jgi:uncharacterized protein (TIGR03067 family)
MRKSLLVLSVLLVGLSVAAEEKPKAKDVKDKLKGTWNVVSIEEGGKLLPEDEIQVDAMIFTGDAVSYLRKNETTGGTYKIDASQKPAQIDLVRTEGPDKGVVQKAIFQIDGDTLKIARNRKNGEVRPKSFDDKDLSITTFKRAKKPDETDYAGVLELVNGDDIIGWAWDSKQPDKPVKVDVFDGDKLLATVVADMFRADLLAEKFGNGKHGFSLATPKSLKDGKAHAIRVKVSGTDEELTSSPMTFKAP